MTEQAGEQTQDKGLLNGYYGYVNQAIETEDGRLVEVHIACADEQWEVGEWYLNNDRIAICDGYDGVEWVDGFKPSETVDDLVTSYDIGTLLDEAIAAKQEVANMGDIDVKVMVTPHYYNNEKGPFFITDDKDDVVVFETYESAQAEIDTLDEGAYHLAHGEHSRPDYQIVK